MFRERHLSRCSAAHDENPVKVPLVHSTKPQAHDSTLTCRQKEPDVDDELRISRPDAAARQDRGKLALERRREEACSVEDLVLQPVFDLVLRRLCPPLYHRNDPGPNLETYTILLAFYSARADPQCLHLFEDMKKTGIDPDCRVFNIMLQYCAKLRDDVVRAKKKSLKFFFELKLRELTPDIDTYNALMEVFAVTGDPLIFKVFEEMIENSIVPNKTTFSTLIKEKKGLDMLRKAGEKGLLQGMEWNAGLLVGAVGGTAEGE
eukprot:TRINITY_DN3005_c0_g1_i4.p1 TRINITY_DN3005_c0_g1~~TRINITY_DN3005_c0_g1_i4.p1  ORF type:complete len:262 (+),score=45.99 TRINITY_DN3005_c0_g1_i4:48-833(+)